MLISLSMLLWTSVSIKETHLKKLKPKLGEEITSSYVQQRSAVIQPGLSERIIIQIKPSSSNIEFRAERMILDGSSHQASPPVMLAKADVC